MVHREDFLQRMKAIETRLAVLNRIYEIYDDFMSQYDIACEKHCCTCCTCNVTATTLEGIRICRYLETSTESAFLYQQIATRAAEKHFQPQVTTNELVQLCADDKAVPEEENNPQWGECPLLQNRQCPIYTVRPFACRCMVSYHNCTQYGYADMDPLIMTVNNVVLQLIEHVDTGGFYGNLIDILMALTSGCNPSGSSKPSDISSNPANITENVRNLHGLLLNQPMRQLMVPPEHRAEIQPLLESLQSIRV
jgi:hypothetical protein